LSPTTNPLALRTRTLVAPALASAVSAVRLDAVPTFTTVTASMP
jgi:hypothetical protein